MAGIASAECPSVRGCSLNLLQMSWTHVGQLKQVRGLGGTSRTGQMGAGAHGYPPQKPFLPVLGLLWGVAPACCFLSCSGSPEAQVTPGCWGVLQRVLLPWDMEPPSEAAPAWPLWTGGPHRRVLLWVLFPGLGFPGEGLASFLWRFDSAQAGEVHAGAATQGRLGRAQGGLPRALL